MSRFEEVSPEEIKRIVENLLKQLPILLGLAGYELIITNEAIGYYISAHIRRVLKE